MSPLGQGAEPSVPGTPELALAVVDSIPAMVAYWDRSETCRFANHAYQAWFGRSGRSLLGTKLSELLGPLYELNEPYIRGALRGETQVFEREIPLPDGSGFRDSLATYTPNFVNGEVAGFFVHVGDATLLKQHERALSKALLERDRALAEARTLRGLLPVCAACKRIRNEAGGWETIESYITARTDAEFSHSLCPSCSHRLYPELTEPER